MTFLTGAHSGLGGFRPEARSVDERVSLTAVIEAVSDVMEATSRHGIVDRALASRVGAQIHLAVAQALGTGRISSGADLVGQQVFRTILSQYLVSADSSYMDQQARQSLLDFMRRHANRTGADFANFVAQFRRGGGYPDRSDRDGSVLVTSARFDGISAADPAFLAAMRRHALHLGLHWAADRPEILSLGHAALELFARTGFTRQSHDRLHTAGFDHHDMLHIARYAEEMKKRGYTIDVNTLADRVASAPSILGGGNAQAEQEWRERLKRFFDNPDDENTRQEMDRALTEIETRGTPQQREHIERLRPLLNLRQQVGAELTTASVAAEAETAEARATREREAAERAAREAERAAREAEEAAAEEARKRLAALRAGSTPEPVSADHATPSGQEPPPSQRADVRPTRQAGTPTLTG